jgi:hypothetical protein
MTNRSVAKYFSFQEADQQVMEELQKWLDEVDRSLAA